MDLEGITLMKMSQTAKEKYCMIQFTCAIFKKNKAKQIQRTDWWLPEGRHWGQREVVKGVKYKLIVIKQRSYRDIMHRMMTVVNKIALHI